jgi:hypothetical protein
MGQQTRGAVATSATCRVTWPAAAFPWARRVAHVAVSEPLGDDVSRMHADSGLMELGRAR